MITFLSILACCCVKRQSYFLLLFRKLSDRQTGYFFKRANLLTTKRTVLGNFQALKNVVELNTLSPPLATDFQNNEYQNESKTSLLKEKLKFICNID